MKTALAFLLETGEEDTLKYALN